jgi:hypothetical protein
MSYSSRGTWRRMTAGIICCAGLSFLPASASAEQATLEGSWSGAGKVTLTSGAVETARCRASFRKKAGNVYGMSAVCATPSTRVAQSAELARVGGNRFSGDFYNPEYGISGTITIVVRGNRLSASLSGGGAHASLALSR